MSVYIAKRKDVAKIVVALYTVSMVGGSNFARSTAPRLSPSIVGYDDLVKNLVGPLSARIGDKD
jgi:hypothetical protein